MVKNKVNAFSPTISPAPKLLPTNEIESASKALEFYYDKGVQDFIVQKKYMGSYCDIYLKANLNETYFISRNGFLVNHIDLEKAIASCSELHDKFDWNIYDTIIIQSEMMPWSTLGQKLITNDFEAYANAHQTHYEYLKQSGLYQKINLVKGSKDYKEIVSNFADKSGLKNGEKADRHIIRQYKSIESLKILDLKNYNHNIELYKKQVHHYGQQTDIHFKPFNILKKVYKNGDEEIVNDNYSYKEINTDECLTFTIKDNETLKNKCQEVNIWFKTLTDNMEEGIMIKPKIAFHDELPPCFKVRNNNYLQMIYGIHFKDEYQRYLKKRTIRKKMENSINQWMINKHLLNTKYKQITDDNYLYKNLMYERIVGESKMKSIDHRL